ncbi:SRPBCC family protein [Gordonia hankookensis]|uniref:SRPBCC family protein n=1 Tax=Gordonia hankookensis TaxID=589403 RepID=A0ABR7WHG9_9ACTN|nr:SRPBCC family protein [Gordonia hankookensis]MBD1322207.1 SRPBCC family protein [Gordonia hankookensis]
MSPTRRVLIADVTVPFGAPPTTTFDYLVDPENRPHWQSSLRRIEDLAPVGDRAGGTGTSWRDITLVPWVRPRLEVIECVAPLRWREIGRWWFVDASLSLAVSALPDGRTEVRARAYLTVPLILSASTLVLTMLAPFALRADLDSAASIVGGY